MKITLGIVDDHELFLRSLSMLLMSMNDINVLIQARSGAEILRQLADAKKHPEVLLVDVNMPQMDGVETAIAIGAKYPTIKLVALSMNDEEETIIRMIKAGCCAYLLKDIHPDELETAVRQVACRGYYNSGRTNFDLRKLTGNGGERQRVRLTDKEQFILQQICSDKPYKTIARDTGLSERTIDGYRETLFGKFEVQSRVGLVLEAIKGGYVRI